MGLSFSRVACLFTFTAALLASPAVFAHAHLQTQIPAANAAVGQAPDALSLTFSEGIEPAFSGVTVTGPDGKAVKTGAVSRAPDNDKQLTVPLADALKAGDYQVQWHVVSVDGHKTKGQYRFTVK